MAIYNQFDAMQIIDNLEETCPECDGQIIQQRCWRCGSKGIILSQAGEQFFEFLNRWI